MTHPLKFIDEIDQALRSQSPETALKAVFSRIEAEADDDEKVNFRLFMTEVVNSRRMGLVLHQNDVPYRKISLVPGHWSAVVEDIVPGSYSLALETGWVLWERDLTRQELIWEFAFPEENLPAAATTAEEALPHSVRDSILDEVCVISVTPGLSTGTIRIDMQ